MLPLALRRALALTLGVPALSLGQTPETIRFARNAGYDSRGGEGDRPRAQSRDRGSDEDSQGGAQSGVGQRGQAV